MVRPLDLKQITHYTMTWNCMCHERTDVSVKQAIIECRHLPVKKLDYIELVPADLKSDLDMLFEPKLGTISDIEYNGNIFDEDDE